MSGLLQAQDVRVEAVLDTSRLRIGEQAKIDIYVSYSAKENGLRIEWPRIGDTLTQKVEVVSVTGIDTTLPKQTNSTRIFQHQQITVSVFDSGYYAIPGFRFVLNGDTTRPLYTNPLMLEVHTVPTDTSAAKIKDVKTVLNEPFNWKWYLPWIYWGLAALLLVAAIILLTLYFSRRKKAVVAEPEKPKVPAHITALASLGRIKEEQVWKEGRIKEYYSSISDTIRLYIEERYGLNALESTTDEIMTAFRSQVIDSQSLDKLKQLLFLSDLVKFAKMVPIEQEHQMTLQHAFDFVNGTKREEAAEAAAVFAEQPSPMVQPAAAQREVPSSPEPVAPKQNAPAPPPADGPVSIPPAGSGNNSVPLRKRRDFKWIVVVLAVLIGGIAGTWIISKLVNHEPDFNNMLHQISSDMNRKCPMTVDRETRLDSTSVLPGRIFQYHYTLVKTDASEIDKRALQEQMEPPIFRYVRESPNFQLQRENKVTMEYVYRDRNGKFLFDIRVKPEDY